jgi:prephenate dehydrogenase
LTRYIIIGTGLIGGSIGLTVKQRGIAQSVLGVDCSVQTREDALRCNCADEVFPSLQDIPRRKEPAFIIVCTPVKDIVPAVQQALELFGQSENLIITDTGSTKEQIVKQIADVRFLGSHPIAGRERNGADAARSGLFEERLTVLTPRQAHPPEIIRTVRQFWESLGSTVTEMDADRHDAVLAATSHLPHIISAVLASYLEADERHFTGTGYDGMARIAAGRPEVWSSILTDNADNILKALNRFESELTVLRQAVESGNAERVEQFLTQAGRKTLVKSER